MEQPQPRTRADHIKDGVHCADLVEVNVARRLVMQLAFHLRNAAENLYRPLFHHVRERATLDQLLDVAEVSLRLLARHQDLDTRPRQASAQHTGLPEFVVAQRKFPEFTQESLGRQSDVEQGGQKHVAANAGRTVEVRCFQCLSSLVLDPWSLSSWFLALGRPPAVLMACCYREEPQEPPLMRQRTTD